MILQSHLESVSLLSIFFITLSLNRMIVSRILIIGLLLANAFHTSVFVQNILKHTIYLTYETAITENCEV
ncbi:MAG: hypothetical protein ACI9LE_000312 [Paraglaciecola sp.]|jgi:hypothetical protein